MTRSPHLRLCLSALALLALACTDDNGAAESNGSETTADEETGDETETETGGEEDPDVALLTHRFGTVELDPLEESTPCVQWTLDNEAALYVQQVTFSNLGYFHHSNWFVVPEDAYPGPDGYWDCGDRGFTELGAAGIGTVLFAQSTQSFVEEQRTLDGAVVKIPPRYKVVGNTHFLNVGANVTETDSFMTLEVIHPKDVDTVLTPFRLSFLDLDIPANAISKFTGVCDDLGERYMAATGVPLDMKLHYALPHYHYLGNFFDLTFTGGDINGESVFSIDGFNGEANGKVWDPALDLTGVEGIRYTCGYDNWRDVNVGWGIGDQEMCVMLGLAESRVIIDISVTGGTVAVGENDGIQEFEGPCGMLMIPKNPAQGPPTDEERDGPLLVPDSGDEGIPPIPECEDHDVGAAPSLEPTLENVFAAMFQPSCVFNACHGVTGQAAGLNLQAPDLLAELMDHEVIGNPGANLIEPGDPENSWLYQLVANCDPTNGEGGAATHMPLNAPVLLNDATIAILRDWIAAGATP